jgi:hypothetical protein
VFGTFGIATPSAPIASTIGVAKTHGHVKLSMTIDEMNRPMMPPAPANPAHSAIARGFSSVGKLEVITESVTGMIMAAATPAMTRENATRSGLRPQRSPTAPNGMSSEARANV